MCGLAPVTRIAVINHMLSPHIACHLFFKWKETKPRLIKSSQFCRSWKFAPRTTRKSLQDVRTSEQEEKTWENTKRQDNVGCRGQGTRRLRKAGFTADLWLTGERLGGAAAVAAVAAVFPLLAVSFWRAATGISLCLCLSFSLCLWSCCRDRSWVWSLGRVRWDLRPAEGSWCWALACGCSRDCESWALCWSSWFGATALYVANRKSTNANWPSLEGSLWHGM